MGRLLVFKVMGALIARMLFAAHNIVAIWRLYDETEDMTFWLLGFAPILLFLEAAVTILWHQGDEYTWFCPSVFLFLCGSVPPIWFLELSVTQKMLETTNSTINALDEVKRSDLEFVYLRVSLPSFSPKMWLQIVEQSLLVILLLGRWLLPKGRITRDQLSQLLLAYLAISSDIAELFNLFQDKQVRVNWRLNYVTLGIWTLSLVQFPLVLTTVKAQKARYCWGTNINKSGVETLATGIALVHAEDGSSLKAAVQHQSSPNNQKQRRSTAPGSKMIAVVALPTTTVENGHKRRKITFWDKMTDISVWGILLTVLLQDGPFFALRIYLIAFEGVSNHALYFFVWKNSVIIILQLYRLLVICCDREKQDDQDQREDHQATKNLDGGLESYSTTSSTCHIQYPTAKNKLKIAIDRRQQKSRSTTPEMSKLIGSPATTSVTRNKKLKK
uniref:Transmembrane protein 26 n=1 Tax=Romanomermis culicivorax TaxID=13658 RepID=A0A915IVS0_ROMCU